MVPVEKVECTQPALADQTSFVESTAAHLDAGMFVLLEQVQPVK